MPSSNPPKPIGIDGSTGEGGGQLVRVAIALAAVTSQPVTINNIRGKRPSRNGGQGSGGGLKAQHVTAIRWLAQATDAQVRGLEVGSHTLTFAPRLSPAAALEGGRSRWIKIDADSGAASTLLILQAILPFLLYAADADADADADVDADVDKDGNGKDEHHSHEPTPIELEITGGTNVAWSPSYEYLDQVLLPRLESSFGIHVSRRLKQRGWSLGPPGRGSICLTIRPLKRGQPLRQQQQQQQQRLPTPFSADPDPDPDSASEEKDSAEHRIKYVDVSIIAPSHMHSDLKAALARELSSSLPDAEVIFKVIENSGHDARIYVLLVARPADDDASSGSSSSSNSCYRWGRDVLTSMPKKMKKQRKKGKGQGKAKKGNQQKGEEHGEKEEEEGEGKELASLVSRRVVADLANELSSANASVCDEFLQDQLVILQALAEGLTSFPRIVPEGPVPASGGDDDVDVLGQRVAQQLDIAAGGGGEGTRRRDRTDRPFGHGSMHTQTARWVASEILPAVEWYNKGNVCRGVGMRFD